MFTLKLYRHLPQIEGLPRQRQTKYLEVERVQINQIGKIGHALEIWAFLKGQDYETYYIGETEPGMDAHGRDDKHLDSAPYSWWEWGLLENSNGKTTEHFRPASYGL